MQLTDSHCHLADAAFSADRPAVQHAASTAGVGRLIVPATHSGDWQAVCALASEHIHCALGIHPWWATEYSDGLLHRLDQTLATQRRLLVGEIGLDYRHGQPDEAARRQQQTCLAAQLELAHRHHRPVVLHNLHATHDLLCLLAHSGVRSGIVHAFSGSLEEAHAFIRLGFLIGIGSLLLHPNAKKAQRAAVELPLDSLVLETDSPFMLPGQRNTPANILPIAHRVAELRNIPLQHVARITEHNIDRLLAF